MKLKDLEIVPGVVVNSKDPRNGGRIKVNAPTLFDPETPIKELPWVWPCFMPGYQYYSRMRDGSLVWVINNPDNYHEYWYIPYFKLNFDTQSIADQGDDVDILFDRNDGSGSARLYYTPNDGIKGENKAYYFQLLPNGIYYVKGASERGIIVKDGKVKLGEFNDTDDSPAVRYKELKAAVDKFCNLLKGAGEALGKASCGAAAGGELLKNAASGFQDDVAKSESKTVELIG